MMLDLASINSVESIVMIDQLNVSRGDLILDSVVSSACIILFLRGCERSDWMHPINPIKILNPLAKFRLIFKTHRKNNGLHCLAA